MMHLVTNTTVVHYFCYCPGSNTKKQVGDIVTKERRKSLNIN